MNAAPQKRVPQYLPKGQGGRGFFEAAKDRGYLRYLSGGALAASLFFLVGCASMGQWAANNERTYRAEYAKGGGAISMTVRPAGGDDQRVTREQIERMFRELEAGRVPKATAEQELRPPGGLAK